MKPILVTWKPKKEARDIEQFKRDFEKLCKIHGIPKPLALAEIMFTDDVIHGIYDMFTKEEAEIRERVLLSCGCIMANIFKRRRRIGGDQ